MDTTGFELNASLRENREVTSKKEWAKPEIEVISKDLIKGGVLPSLHEGETTFGFRGQMS